MEFVNNAILFFGLVLALIYVWAFFSFGGKVMELFGYIKTEVGRGALKSAGVAVGAILIISFLIFIIPNNAQAVELKKGTWFNDAGVYMGLDYTRKPSPQCRPESVDNRGTSNLGFKGNIWQSRSENIRVNAKYTHHSCFIGKDRNGYDGFGIEVEWKLFSRKR